MRSMNAFGAKEREQLALTLMNVDEIIERLEHFLKALDNPQDDMALLWLRDDGDTADGATLDNILPLK